MQNDSFGSISAVTLTRLHVVGIRFFEVRFLGMRLDFSLVSGSSVKFELGPPQVSLCGSRFDWKRVPTIR